MTDFFRRTKLTTSLRTQIGFALIAAVLVIGGLIVGPKLLTAPRADAAVSQWWQLGCYPYGDPNFAFGQYISGWGYHIGEDVCHEPGIPVYAASDGIVMYSAQTPPDYRWGNLIIIQHQNPDGNYVVSLYGHLNTDRRVAAGQSVSKGQRIGTVAPSDYYVNGGWDPHLHFGIHPGPYNANVGTYALWVHGYENSCCGGWTKSQDYVNARIAPYDHVPFDVVGDNQLISWNGGQIQVTFRVRNTGSWTWRKDGNTSTPVRLGTVGPLDRASAFSVNGTLPGWVGANRITLDADTPAGGLATFTATFQSNQVAGSYTECFSPVVDGVGWMTLRPICVNLAVDQPSLHYQWVTQSQTPATIGTGVTYQDVTLQIKNTGYLSWPVNGDVKLGTWSPRDYDSSLYTPAGTGAWLSAHRLSAIDRNVTVPGKTTVDQGEVAEFSARLTIPNSTPVGNYQLYVRPVKENVAWFPEDYGMFFPITVTVPAYQHQVTAQSFSGDPSNFHQNSTMTATLAIKNTGRATWPVTGPNLVRLGTWNPRDRSSGFSVFTGNDGWLSASRPSNIDGAVTSLNPFQTTGASSIAPGQTAWFNIPLKANADRGTYNEYFNVLSEGVTWFPDLGIFFPLTVIP